MSTEGRNARRTIRKCLFCGSYRTEKQRDRDTVVSELFTLQLKGGGETKICAFRVCRSVLLHTFK